jgi:hypothetical protein
MVIRVFSNLRGEFGRDHNMAAPTEWPVFGYATLPGILDQGTVQIQVRHKNRCRMERLDLDFNDEQIRKSVQDWGQGNL